MTVNIGSEMASKTTLFNFDIVPRVLDLGMAPGGFSASVLTRYPESTIDAITLPADHGGHKVMVQSSNINIIFADITMLQLSMVLTIFLATIRTSSFSAKTFPTLVLSMISYSAVVPSYVSTDGRRTETDKRGLV
jgi:hypothetical protein